jgi:glucan phosphoethanolaminetransferase (alkaline phosphatase superfamily)
LVIESDLNVEQILRTSVLVVLLLVFLFLVRVALFLLLQHVGLLPLFVIAAFTSLAHFEVLIQSRFLLLSLVLVQGHDNGFGFFGFDLHILLVFLLR